MTLEDQAAAVATKLAFPANSGYLKFPLPSPVDNEVSALLEILKNGSEEQKKQIRSAFGNDQWCGLLGFAERMAILAVRNQSKEPLIRALLAIILEDFAWDPRENVLILSLVEHSARKLGLGFRGLLDDVSAVASKRAMDHLIGFAERPPEGKTIDKMGYYEDSEDGQFLYVRNW